MPESGMERLHSLLFNGGRELVNVKFFPGSNRGLTAERLCSAAAVALDSVFKKEMKDNPPTSGRKKTSMKATFKVQK